MDWFRTLLTEKAHSFQIVVFTCRPSDYLLPSALPKGTYRLEVLDGVPHWLPELAGDTVAELVTAHVRQHG